MRRALRIFGWLAAILLTPVVLLAGGIAWFVYGAGEDTWTWALEQATGFASGPGLTIETGRFRRGDDGVLHLDSLALADADGRWLEVEDVALDLSAADLLDGALTIDRLAAERVEVLRLPADETPVEETASDGRLLPENFQWPRAPLPVTLKELAVEEVILPEGVAPVQSRYRVTGALADAGAVQRLDLDIRPLDLGESFVRADITADFAAERMDVDIAADMPAIRPLADALGVAPEDRVRLSMTGGGPFGEAEIDVDLTVQNALDLVGRLDLALAADGGYAASLDATANLIGGALSAPKQALGDVVHVDVAVSGPSTDQVTIDRLKLDSPAVTLTAEGNYDGAANTVRLAANADIRADDALAPWLTGARFETAALQVDLDGALDETLTAKMRADIAAPRFQDYAADRIVAEIDATSDLETARGHAVLTIDEPQTGNPQYASLAGADPTLAFDFVAGPEALEISGLDVRTAAGTANGHFTVDLEQREMDGELHVEAEDLARAPQLAQLLTGGRGNLDLTIEGLGENRGTVDASLHLEELQWRDPQFADVAGSTVDLNVEAEPMGEAMVARISGNTAKGAEIAANATLEGETIDGDYSLSLPELPPGLAPPSIEGLRDLAVSGEIGGTLNDPRVTGTARAADLRVSGREIAQPRLRFSAFDLAGSPDFDAELSFRSGGQTGSLDVAGGFDPAANRLSLDRYRARLGSARLEGRGNLDLATTGFDGQATLKVDDLSDLSELAGMPLAGDADGTVTLKPEGERLDAKIDLTARNVRAGDMAAVGRLDVDLDVTDLTGELPTAAGRVQATDIDAGGARIARAAADLQTRGETVLADVTVERIEAGGAQIEAAVAEITLDPSGEGAPRIGGDVLVTAITSGENRITQVTADLGGTIERPVARLTANLAAPVEVSLRTEIAADLTDPETLGLRVADLVLETPQGDITSRSPFIVALRGDLIAVRGLDLAASAGGAVTGDATYGPSQILAQLEIADLALGPLAALGGVEGLSGVANATIRLDTKEPGDTGRLDLTLTDLRMPEEVGDFTFQVSAQGRWADGEVGLKTTIAGPFEQPLVAEASGVLPPSGDRAIPIPPADGAVRGRLEWRGNLQQLVALLPESDNLAAGPARFDVRMDGTWSQPRLQGEAVISDARYENLLSGTILQDVDMSVRFNDRGVGDFQLSARDPVGGRLRGSGEMVLLGDDRTAEVSLDLDGLLAVRRDEAEVKVSGRTTVTWDGQAVDVVGRHTLDHVEIRLVAPDLPPSVVAIQLERDKVAEAEAEEPGPPLPVNLDIRIDAPGQFFVRGRGLESEWRGQATITGTADNPQVTSDFNAVRGSLSLLGKDFDLEEGSIGLTGDLTPEFRIVLVRETEDLTGRIIVSGRPSQPDIDFTSTPELPEGEVLPRLLFDKARQSLSPVEALNLAQGIRTLTNGKRGATDRIRDAVGLDVLRLESGDDPESAGAISAGRYVREGVYVGAKQSVDSESGSVVVEIDVLPNVKVDTEIDRDGSTSTGITWEKRY
ncbi:MAG: hypothetical protein TEF_00720 [Rhizobiales bacterium NRL2]|jgi:translocation and assembly module TamB|nr:MAG: hypothetical protein TEF_00720 [Rhizobiales bacterium NRL2]